MPGAGPMCQRRRPPPPQNQQLKRYGSIVEWPLLSVVISVFDDTPIIDVDCVDIELRLKVDRTGGAVIEPVAEGRAEGNPVAEAWANDVLPDMITSLDKSTDTGMPPMVVSDAPRTVKAVVDISPNVGRIGTPIKAEIDAVGAVAFARNDVLPDIITSPEASTDTGIPPINVSGDSGAINTVVGLFPTVKTTGTPVGTGPAAVEPAEEVSCGDNVLPDITTWLDELTDTGMPLTVVSSAPGAKNTVVGAPTKVKFTGLPREEVATVGGVVNASDAGKVV